MLCLCCCVVVLSFSMFCVCVCVFCLLYSFWPPRFRMRKAALIGRLPGQRPYSTYQSPVHTPSPRSVHLRCQNKVSPMSFAKQRLVCVRQQLPKRSDMAVSQNRQQGPIPEVCATQRLCLALLHHNLCSAWGNSRQAMTPPLFSTTLRYKQNKNKTTHINTFFIM